MGQYPPASYRHAWAGVMATSLLLGLAACGIWSAAWATFGDLGGQFLLPAAVLLTAALAGPYRQAALAAARLLGGRSPEGRALAAALLATVAALALVGIKGWNPNEARFLPEQLRWLRPYPMFRALLLAPLWGGWAMLVVPQFLRPDERTDPATTALAGGCGPVLAAACMGAVAVLSVVYFNYMSWWQLTIPATAVLAAIAAGLLLGRRFGGLGRDVLLAANLLTQLAFLIAYLGNL